MFATIINVYVHSGDIYLCLMCAIADVNKRIASIFYKYINQWFRESKLSSTEVNGITSKKVNGITYKNK